MILSFSRLSSMPSISSMILAALLYSTIILYDTYVAYRPHIWYFPLPVSFFVEKCKDILKRKSFQLAFYFSSRFLSGQFALIFLTFSFSRNISSIAIPTFHWNMIVLVFIFCNFFFISAFFTSSILPSIFRFSRSVSHFRSDIALSSFPS